MFTTLLIANRGEIACRVARTARRMGIRTVAVFSDADRDALHVRACDEAFHIGAAAAADSYLRGDNILEVARRSGARAIHPGYGFLSENAGFARACAEAGIVFIGPPVAAIEAMGSKSAAKAIMTKAGVPLIPGYHGAGQTDDELRQHSQAVGYPQLIKAAAGGGGRGMRVVMQAGEFEAALQSARREARAAFGDEQMLIERYLHAPRHVELQVFADTHGQVVHLFERDCSIQRRHQKVIEEAPAPGMTAALRTAMGDAAISAARAIAYEGAGTVEFLLEQTGAFYFMEMNTRLQVEHPVTEMVSGQDLVEWQLRVAAGEPLPLQQAQLQLRGHAFEARVYAEVPERDFLPATGTLEYLQMPAETAGVRIDTGVSQGDAVSVHYDPMLAKLIVWGEDRGMALQRLQQALAGCRIAGVTTNLAFLSTLCALEDFAQARLDTGFIDRHRGTLFPVSETVPVQVLAAACLAELYHQQQLQRQDSGSTDPWSPWQVTDGWHMNLEHSQTLMLEQQGQRLPVTVHFRPQQQAYVLETSQGRESLAGEYLEHGTLRVCLGDQVFVTGVYRDLAGFTVFHQGRCWRLALHDPLQEADEQQVQGGNLSAPMPGVIVAVDVSVGDQVSAGQRLMVMVAMKMEHAIIAPDAGEVAAIHFAVGDQVGDGDVLLSLERRRA
ncbi:MAG: acetyl/propionyl/methylcrotonyl-CoA carboxylase subunit alpha [Thiothrix sp.]|nr:acetyl/propionyl/methylcrotonyl-CoA carboxylase subunit alpha [Thiothrix sp.]HPQ95392.1 acetyl/propionyl/methylcrotonyl-CoA carboxylase subunit alpha [Thiolinea sp.]